MIEFGSLTAFARKQNVTLGHLVNVIGGRNKSAAIEKAIANNTGFPLEELFPDRYPESA